MVMTGYQNIRKYAYLIWSCYVSIPKIVRLPVTGVVLLFLSVIFANVVFGVSDR